MSAAPATSQGVTTKPQRTPLPTEAVSHESDEAYQQARKRFLSSHALREFRRNPRLFRDKELGLAPAEFDYAHFVIGRAAHALILEGQAEFDRRFPLGARTKGGKSPTLSKTQRTNVMHMAFAVHQHTEAARLVRGVGRSEATVRSPLEGVPCQARIDRLRDTELIDLKTVSNLEEFESDFFRLGYHHQLAFYRSIIRSIAATTLPVFMIAVEKTSPFRVGVWHVDEGVLNTAEAENAEQIRLLLESRRTDIWPTGYEDIRSITKHAAFAASDWRHA